MDDPGCGTGLAEAQISLTHPGCPGHSLQIRGAPLYCSCCCSPTQSLGERCLPLQGTDAGECPLEQGQVPAAPAPGCLRALWKTLGWDFASSQLGQFPGLRSQLPILTFVLPSFHPIFPRCSCWCQHLAKLPRGFCPCHGRLPIPPATGFGDSARIILHPLWLQCGKRIWGEGRREERGSSQSNVMGWSNSR